MDARARGRRGNRSRRPLRPGGGEGLSHQTGLDSLPTDIEVGVGGVAIAASSGWELILVRESVRRRTLSARPSLTRLRQSVPALGSKRVSEGSMSCGHTGAASGNPSRHHRCQRLRLIVGGVLDTDLDLYEAFAHEHPDYR